MKRRTKLSLIALCLSATLTASVSAKDVTIYYTNDLHAHVSPGKIPVVDKERLVGGFANIATIVNDAKKKVKMYFSLMREIILPGLI
jgi:2',3'-cyclic-nucleotide 2'-phosphodiesterase (5'-nucleotidase family)